MKYSRQDRNSLRRFQALLRFVSLFGVILTRSKLKRQEQRTRKRLSSHFTLPSGLQTAPGYTFPEFREGLPRFQHHPISSHASLSFHLYTERTPIQTSFKEDAIYEADPPFQTRPSSKYLHPTHNKLTHMIAPESKLVSVPRETSETPGSEIAICSSLNLARGLFIDMRYEHESETSVRPCLLALNIPAIWAALISQDLGASPSQPCEDSIGPGQNSGTRE